MKKRSSVGEHPLKKLTLSSQSPGGNQGHRVAFVLVEDAQYHASHFLGAKTLKGIAVAETWAA